MRDLARGMALALALGGGKALADEPVPPVPAVAVPMEQAATYPRPCVIPAHWASFTTQVFPTRCVQRAKYEELKVPQYVQEFRPCFVTVKRPVLVTTEGPVMIPQRVPDVREIRVPVYKDVAVECGCGTRTERVVDHVETRFEACGWKVVYVPAPGNLKVPHVSVRYEDVQVPVGNRWQWVRKDDRIEKRLCGYESAEEPIPGAAPRVETERAFVPCDPVTVIANPEDPSADAKSAREAPLLSGTRRAVTRRELEKILAAIEEGAERAEDAAPPPGERKEGANVR